MSACVEIFHQFAKLKARYKVFAIDMQSVGIKLVPACAHDTNALASYTDLPIHFYVAIVQY